MTTDLPPTVRLNNHFQGLNRLSSISYQGTDHGPNVPNRWTVTVKIDGQVRGSYSAARMATARETAAQQVLDYLGIP